MSDNTSRATERVRRLFDAAVEIDDPDEQQAFLRNACQGDIPIQREVESLLAAYKSDPMFLNEPAIAKLRATGDEPPVHVVVSGYEVSAEIGRGGMGVVYRARRSSQPNDDVALKLIRTDAHLDKKLAQRFLREGEIGGRLKHQQIVPILDIGKSVDGRDFLCMPFLSGGTLQHRIQRGEFHNKFAPIAEVVASIARVVAYMHSQDVVHRDLKPANVLFDADENSYVSDFGLAKPIDDVQQLTSAGVPLGTLPYMSPEQLRGVQSPSKESDIYSLGVILYELLTGQVPIRHLPGEGHFDYRDRLLTELPAAPDSRNQQVPRDLSAICMTCLERNAAARYPTADELAQDLSRFLNHERPLGATSRTPRYMKFPVGDLELDVYVLVGGNGRVRYEYPTGIVGKYSKTRFVPPVDVCAEYKEILAERQEAARKRGAPFVNGMMVRIDHFDHGVTSDEHESPFPLRLRTSLTKYFRTQVTNGALDWRLRDGRTIREKYLTEDPADFAGCRLSNPLCVNLSVITEDNYIYIVKRGQRVGTNPGGWAPAVSGTGNPSFDIEAQRYNPWRTALREARQEILGHSYVPDPCDVTFFGLARVVRNRFPFLFGELRVRMTSRELESQVPQDRNETLAVIGRPFTVESVANWALELYRELDEQGKKTPRAHTTIFSLLQSLKYSYLADWLNVVRRFKGV